MRILVVDDEPAIRLLLRVAFERAGYEVAEASDGDEALEVCGNSWDVIITDLMMPRRGGLDLIRHVRKTMPAVKLIAISGAFGGAFLETASEVGADATIEKPFDPDAAVQIVRNIISGGLSRVAPRKRAGPAHTQSDPSHGRRAETRSSINTQTILRILDSDTAIEVCIVDVSVNGMGVISRFPVAPATAVGIRYNGVLTFAEVRYCRHQGDAYRIGLWVDSGLPLPPDASSTESGIARRRAGQTDYRL